MWVISSALTTCPWGVGSQSVQCAGGGGLRHGSEESCARSPASWWQGQVSRKKVDSTEDKVHGW